MIILIVELEQIQLCGTQRTGFTGMYRNGILSTYLATFLCRNATVCYLCNSMVMIQKNQERKSNFGREDSGIL